VTTLQSSLYAMARRVARPPGPVRPETSQAAEDFYFRAFPRMVTHALGRI
jgi:hypothetical protein